METASRTTDIVAQQYPLLAFFAICFGVALYFGYRIFDKMQQRHEKQLLEQNTAIAKLTDDTREVMEKCLGVLGGVTTLLQQRGVSDR